MAELVKMEAPRKGLVPVQSIVTVIASLLKRAESGELRGFAFAAEYCNHPDTSREKGTEWGMCGEAFNVGLIGGLEMVKLSLMEHISELSDAQEIETVEVAADSDDPDSAG